MNKLKLDIPTAPHAKGFQSPSQNKSM